MYLFDMQCYWSIWSNAACNRIHYCL